MSNITNQLQCILAVGRCYNDLCNPEPPFNIGTFVRFPFVDIVRTLNTVADVEAYQSAYMLFGNIETGLERMVENACKDQIALIKEGHIERECTTDECLSIISDYVHSSKYELYLTVDKQKVSIYKIETDSDSTNMDFVHLGLEVRVVKDNFTAALNKLVSKIKQL